MEARRTTFLAPHEEKHRRFVSLLQRLERQAADPEINTVFRAFQVQVFLTDLLPNHILENDKHFGKSLRAARP
jgi:hemerythrin